MPGPDFFFYRLNFGRGRPLRSPETGEIEDCLRRVYRGPGRRIVYYAWRLSSGERWRLVNIMIGVAHGQIALRISRACLLGASAA